MVEELLIAGKAPTRSASGPPSAALPEPKKAGQGVEPAAVGANFDEVDAAGPGQLPHAFAPLLHAS
jgi:hypothetical protein